MVPRGWLVKKEVRIKLIENAIVASNSHLMKYHCIAYQALELDNIIQTVNAVNFMKSEGLNHPQFHEFQSMHAHYVVVIYFPRGRWVKMKRDFIFQVIISSCSQN